MTFGFPNTLLRANDIDPEMLFEFPEDLRAEILSTLQPQLEEWHREQATLQAQANQPDVISSEIQELPDVSIEYPIRAPAGQPEAVAASNVDQQPSIDG